VEEFLQNIQNELLTRTYKPTKNRRVEIPKGGGKTRRLGIPTIKDRVVQGAVTESLGSGLSVDLLCFPEIRQKKVKAWNQFRMERP
jgi:hypothetical protein